MAKNQVQAGQRLMIILIGIGLAVLVVGGGTAILLLNRAGSAISGNTIQIDDTNLVAPIAIVNNIAITNDMLTREVNTSRFNIMEPLPPLKGDNLARARSEALNQLITRQLILQAAAQQNFSVEPAAVAERVRLLYGSPDDERLIQALKSAGLTATDLHWWVSELLTVEEFTVKVVMGSAQPEDRQKVYNQWLNAQQAQADIQTFLGGQPTTSLALPGHPAPNFTLQTLDGSTVSLADFRGQVVLVNFWATWCPSCIAEMPDYEAVYQQQPIADFVVLGVNLQENSEQVQKFSEGLQLSFPILLDADGQITIRDYQVVGMPGSIIIDRQGQIFYRHIGPMSGDLLLEKLNALEARPL